MLLVILLITDLLLIVSFSFTPYITRKTELFGVSLPAEKTNLPELAALRSSYRNQMLVCGVVLVVVSLAIGLTATLESIWAFVVWLSLIFVYLILSFAFYLPRHRAMRQIKTEQGWAIETKPAVIVADTTPAKADTISPAWLLLYPLIILLSLGVVALIWPQVPEQVPMHFNAAGAPDSFAPKGVRAVVPMLIVEVFLAAIMALVFFVIRFAKRQSDASNPGETLRQDKHFRRLQSIFLLLIGCATLLLMAGIQVISLLGVKQGFIIMVLTVVFMVVIFAGLWFVMFRIGQGGSRLKTSSERSSSNINYDDDRYWKLGMFYFNPSDPAVFVEKRFGVGWTSNFARPLNWVLIAGLIVFIVLLFGLALFFTR